MRGGDGSYKGEDKGNGRDISLIGLDWHSAVRTKKRGKHNLPRFRRYSKA